MHVWEFLKSCPNLKRTDCLEIGAATSTRASPCPTDNNPASYQALVTRLLVTQALVTRVLVTRLHSSPESTSRILSARPKNSTRWICAPELFLPDAPVGVVTVRAPVGHDPSFARRSRRQRSLLKAPVFPPIHGCQYGD